MRNLASRVCRRLGLDETQELITHTCAQVRDVGMIGLPDGRETAILQLVAEGKRAADIARGLHLTVSTIRSHLHKTYAKLEVPDRAQVVIKATEMAWI